MARKMLIGIAAGLICTITVLPAAAQGYIKGTVYDAQKNVPVKGANITYAKTSGTSTDINGRFTLPCKDSMRITLSHIGYQTTKKTIDDCGAQVRIFLRPLSYYLQKSTIEDQAYIKGTTLVETLQQMDLNRQSGLRLKDALNSIPGVEMQTRSPFGGQRITIRGYYPSVGKSVNFNGLGYQLYFNNIPITDATGTTIMDDIDFLNLGQVNIIKGPSPLYGNAIGGIVSLYSQELHENGTTISQEAIFGSYGLFRDNSSIQAKTDDMDLTINYGRQSYDSFRPHDHSKKDYLSLLGHFKVSNRQSISTYFSYNYSDEQLAGNIDSSAFYAQKAMANPDYVNNDGGVKIKSFRGGVTSLHRFNTHFENKTTVFASGHTLNQNFAHGFNYYNNLNYGARTTFSYRRQFRNVGFNGKLGAFIQRSTESVDGVFIPPSISPPFTSETEPQIPSNKQNDALNYNLFTQWDVRLPQDFKITVGGILNFNRFGIRDMLNNNILYSGSATKSQSFNPTFSPSVSVRKSFRGNALVYASINTGNTPPLLGDILNEDGSVNDKLNPENAVQYEVGSKGKLLNGRLSYKLALFDLEINNRLAIQYKEGTSFTTNVGKQQNQGLELLLKYRLIENNEAVISLLNLWGSYIYSDFTYDEFKIFGQNTAGNDSTIANYSDNAVAGVAPHQLNAGVDMQTKPGIYLHVKYKYMDQAPVTFNNDHYVKSYDLLSVRLGLRRKLGNHFRLNAFIGSNNITGSTYYNFLFVGQNRSALGDGYISPAPYKATVFGGATLSYNF